MKRAEIGLVAAVCGAILAGCSGTPTSSPDGGAAQSAATATPVSAPPVTMTPATGTARPTTAPPTTASTTPETTITGRAPVKHACAAAGAKEVSLRASDGVELRGLLIGDGPRGIVLGHQNLAELCSWFPFADELGLRYSVLALDFRGFGSSEAAPEGHETDLPLDVIAGIRYLQAHGARRIAVGGASMGGTAAVVAAADHPAGVVGVFTVSAPTIFESMNALVAARELRAPGLFIAATDDDVATGAQLLHDVAPVGSAELLIVPGSAHGTLLVDLDPQVGQAIRRFLARVLR